MVNIDLVNTDEISSCSLTALDAMERMSQTKKVEAVLLENNINLSMLHIEVPQKGSLRINGLTATPDQKERISNIIQEMSDFSNIESNINVLSGGI